MIYFLLKTIISGLVIASAAWLAGKRPILAGFIIALPLMSMISILLSYAEYRNMEKINQFANSIFVAIPLSLAFFIPFLLNKWLKLNFVMTYASAIVCLILAFVLHQLIFKSSLLR
jgi:hypothetical protein